MHTGWLRTLTPPTRRAPHVPHGTPPHSSAPAMAPAELFEQWHSSERGLTRAEAQRRLLEVGPNEPARRRRGAALGALLAFLTNPLVVILLVASGVSALLGDIANAVIIAGIVVLSVLLNFFQTYRSQRAAERLRAAVAPTASVLRDGVWSETPRHDLVPGDVIRLSAGDQVPADARLLETRDLHLQQAALTGESMPVEKDASALPAVPRQLVDPHHCR